MEKIKKHIFNLLFMYKQIFSISKSRILLIILQCAIDALNMRRDNVIEEKALCIVQYLLTLCFRKCHNYSCLALLDGKYTNSY